MSVLIVTSFLALVNHVDFRTGFCSTSHYSITPPIILKGVAGIDRNCSLASSILGIR
jgi:hypothetical protein